METLKEKLSEEIVMTRKIRLILKQVGLLLAIMAIIIVMITMLGEKTGTGDGIMCYTTSVIGIITILVIFTMPWGKEYHPMDDEIKALAQKKLDEIEKEESESWEINNRESEETQEKLKRIINETKI